LGYDGSRSSTGNVVLLPTAPTATPAIFEIKLCQGRNVIISFDAFTMLSGDNGGSLKLDIGPTEKGINGATFSTNEDCNFITPLRVGGTLHIPDLALPGLYTGSFAITFNHGIVHDKKQLHRQNWFTLYVNYAYRVSVFS
jgi:hypothetical protein